MTTSTEFTLQSEHACFGGVQRFYRHFSEEVGLPMGFGVYLPPQASKGPVPALVFLAGQPSHAFAKGPMLPPPGQPQRLDPTGSYAREVLTGADPDPAVWEFGRRALAAAAAHLELPVTELLYARVDVIGGAADATLLELELVEPGLGWSVQPGPVREAAERRFAVAVADALERLGLGPMSHRRN